jgi:hypothetical protein
MDVLAAKLSTGIQTYVHASGSWSSRRSHHARFTPRTHLSSLTLGAHQARQTRRSRLARAASRTRIALISFGSRKTRGTFGSGVPRHARRSREALNALRSRGSFLSHHASCTRLASRARGASVTWTTSISGGAGRAAYSLLSTLSLLAGWAFWSR